MSDETVIIRKTPPSFAYLFWVSGVRRGESIMLHEDGVTIGRSATVDVALDDPTVSAEHARFRFEDGTWFAYDLAASNPVEVAGQPIGRQALADKDRIRIGITEFIFRLVR
jgi:pSer/pThr/pTyr-binding forkhead associated (FHA) protein